jgi:hypothetical protein
MLLLAVLITGSVVIAGKGTTAEGEGRDRFGAALANPLRLTSLLLGDDPI